VQNIKIFTVAVLAGGKSQRMGQDKSIMTFRGEVLIQRVLNKFVRLANEVIIIAPRNQEYLSLGVKVEPDILPGRGPLGGLYTALIKSSNQEVALIACDMPFVNPGLLLYQLDILLSDDMDVVVPSSEKGLEPLHAVYRKDTSLPAVKKALDSGERRLISWFSNVRVRILTQNETNPFDPLGLMFYNINTPEELTQAEKLGN
jgi:molybdopterin-guanine dinucleotide biosynthesis protein A